MMEERAFGEAGRRIIIEECLRGSECSVHALVSGKSFRMLATARDHKRALDDDLGPNTGGMGAVSPADNWNAAREREFAGSIMQPLLEGLTRNGTMFRGLLFPGLMITQRGVARARIQLPIWRSGNAGHLAANEIGSASIINRDD